MQIAHDLSQIVFLLLLSRSFVKVLALSVQNQTSEDDALKGNCNDFKIRELQAIAILHLGGGGGNH